MKGVRFAVLAMGTLFIWGCKNENNETLFPVIIDPCDSISYTKHISMNIVSGGPHVMI